MRRLAFHCLRALCWKPLPDPCTGYPTHHAPPASRSRRSLRRTLRPGGGKEYLQEDGDTHPFRLTGIDNHRAAGCDGMRQHRPSPPVPRSVCRSSLRWSTAPAALPGAHRATRPITFRAHGNAEKADEASLTHQP